MSDYNEHLISQAGGDGPEKLVDLAIQIHPLSGVDTTITPVEFINFTNIPMSRVKDAIDLLNDDHVELIPKPRTEDFTMIELFAHGELYCKECGVNASNYEIHTAWHNKLLP